MSLSRGARAPSPSPSPVSANDMTSLPDVVLDYLITKGYASTARVMVESQTKRSSARVGKGGVGEADIVDKAGQVGTGTGEITPDGMEVDGDEVEAGAEAGAGAGSSVPLSAKGKGKASTARPAGVHLDERALVALEQRQAIVSHVLNGAIIRAVEALNAHFPTVLDETRAEPTFNGNGSGGGSGSGNPPRRSSNGNGLGSASAWSSNGTISNGNTNGHSNGSLPPVSPDHALPVMHTSTNPAHVKLNLSIQAFIESFRQLAPSSSPSTPSSSIGSLPGPPTSAHLPLATSPGGSKSSNGSGSSPHSHAHAHSQGVTLTNALTAAQGLHQEAKKLGAEDRAVYLLEIKDVVALFAYTDPESSILRGFLDQNRRIALAEQINRAILRSEGRSATSCIETFARRTTAIWAIMGDKAIDSQPNWTAADGPGKEQLSRYLKGRGRDGFTLRDYVSHTWT